MNREQTDVVVDVAAAVVAGHERKERRSTNY